MCVCIYVCAWAGMCVCVCVSVCVCVCVTSLGSNHFNIPEHTTKLLIHQPMCMTGLGRK
jgi:hypothetical protein